MDLIFDILKRLKKYELRQIRNSLKASPFEYEKVGKLFELVLKNRDKDESWFAQKLYAKEPDNTFRVTKSRLKRLLEDVVLNDKSLTDYNADFINALLQSKKRQLQGEILLGRGAVDASRNILFQSISLARKFSLPAERFQGEFLLFRSQSVNMSVKEYQKRTENLKELNRINYLVNEAAIAHYSIKNLLTSQTINDEERLNSIGNDIDDIGKIADETESPLAKYYFLLTKILYLQYTFNFEGAFQACIQYLELIQSEPAVHSNQRLGSAYYQLAEISLRKNDLPNARKYTDLTLKMFPKEHLNYLIVLEASFRVAFFSEDFQEAEKIIGDAMKHPHFELSKMRAAKWHFFNASLYFRTGRIKDALMELNDSTSLLSDKMGWNLSFRLLEIMLLFEAGHYDLLDTKILNMRQFIKRTQKTSELYRPMVLISMLMDWHKNSLDLRKAFPVIRKKLDNLSEFHENIPFNPSSTELIRLENWMQEKYSSLKK